MDWIAGALHWVAFYKDGVKEYILWIKVCWVRMHHWRLLYVLMSTPHGMERGLSLKRA